MNIADQIYDNLQTINSSNEDHYSLFQVLSMEEKILYGKNFENHIVFAMHSQNTQLRPLLRKTQKLIFWFNAKCNIMVDDVYSEEQMNILMCLSQEKNEILAFIRLTLSFSEEMKKQDARKLHELFSALTRLFANAHKANQKELQGFYSELYTVRYFSRLGLNLSEYWQKKEKLKFDFSISQQKKLEVKSTTKEERIHHFQHEQLLSDLYDICVISILLRPDDAGLSLLQLISEVQEIAADRFDTLMYIEDFVKNFDENELREIRYDTTYIDRNIRIYRAENIPKFQEEHPKGVSKAEYDSDLSASPCVNNVTFINWTRSIEHRFELIG